MKAVEGALGGVGDAPRLTAVEEDGDDHDLVEHARHPGLDLLFGNDYGDPPPNLTCTILEGLHGAEGPLAVGSKLTLPRRRYLLRQPLPPSLDRELPRASGTDSSAGAASRRPGSAARRSGT